MFAQLVGLPGSGKSSVAAWLAERHPDHITHVTVPYEPLHSLIKKNPLQTVTAFLQLIPLLLFALFDRNSEQGWRARLAPVATLLNLLVQHRRLRAAAAAAGDRIFLFDEFAYQRVIGILSHATHPPSRLKIACALACLRGYEMPAIFLSTPPENAEKRVEHRAEGWPRRWAALEAPTRSLILAQQASLLDEIFVCTRRGSWIDSSADLGECAERVHHALKSYAVGSSLIPVRVAHFTFNFGRYSGAARQASGMISKLENYDAIVFSAERGRPATAFERGQNEPRRIVRLPRNPVSAFACIAWLSVLHDTKIFHLHGLVGAGLLSGFILRRKTILKTTLLGSDDFDSIRQRDRGPLMHWLARRVDLNIAPSSTLASINRRSLPDNLVVTLPNGVDTQGHRFAEARPKRMPVFCVVGLICERKQTHLAIQRFLGAYASLDGAKLYVVGPTGSDPQLDEGSAEYLDRCHALIPEADRDKVVFTGLLDSEAVQSIYLQSLSLLCFSEAEGMPNALLEAMAANCVPITGEIGGIAREVIEDKRQGFVLTEADAAPSVEELIACSASLGPRQRIETGYDLSHIARRYEAIYSALLQASE